MTIMRKLTDTIESEFPYVTDEDKTTLTGVVGLFLWEQADDEAREDAITFAHDQEARITQS